MGRLDGRVALVTEAGRGIGLATARRFAQEGAAVCAADIAGAVAEEAAGSLRGEGLVAFGMRLDVTDREEAEAAVSETAGRYERLDILVNNARITCDNLIFRMMDEDWRSALDVHLTGAFLCSRAAQKHIVENRYGRIINVSSTSALGNRASQTTRLSRQAFRASRRRSP